MAVVQVHIDAHGSVVEKQVHANNYSPDVVVWLTEGGARHTIVFVNGSPFAEDVFPVPGGRAIRMEAESRATSTTFMLAECERMIPT